MRKNNNFLVWGFVISLLSILDRSEAQYKVGVGIADCTGPAAEIVFMGYAKSTQKGCGIHLRQFSRAFVFDDGVEKAAFVSVDAGMMAHGVHNAVLGRLQKHFNDTFSDSNLILSGTHTHGAPGGYLMYFMYDIPNLGFVKETFDALVDGITRSVVRAHENMVEAKIYLSSGELLGANINRSPVSYVLNPQEERDKYKYDVDKEMVQLKLVKSSDNSLLGAISWFAVHPTSMNYTNCLITSDNVGYASVLLEKMINKRTQIGKGPFVAAFASTNLGDVSPNTKGPKCIDTGEECNVERSTCHGQSKYCVASGPGENMFESTKIIAEKLFEKAKFLLDSEDSKEVQGPIRHIQRYVDMPSESAVVKLPNGTEKEVHGCLPAMGYSFAAGTTDGVGEFGFSQGTRSENSYWNKIRDLLFQPTPDDIECHRPKPILINTGRISTPYEWQPRIVSTQLIQLGEVILIAVPGEFTTMSGRRLRSAVVESVVSNGGAPQTKTIITGLSNVYTSYITTPEEYQLQRYEGASTIFGPHTLTLYLKIYKELAEAMYKGVKSGAGPRPPNLSSKVISLVPGVMFDTSGLVHHFGDCLTQPPTVAERGSTVDAKFVSGHPRNSVTHEETFLTVEKLIEGDQWTVVATDADWQTKFIWQRTSSLLGGSEATIEWQIPDYAPLGTYRLRHFGYYKSFFGGIYPYNGSTNKFEVIDKKKKQENLI